MLNFTLLELATPGQDLCLLEQHHLDAHRPFEPARGFNNLADAWGSQVALVEKKITLALTPELADQLATLQPSSGIGNKAVFLRTLLAIALQQLQAKREGGLLNVECRPGEAHQFEQLARERHLDLPSLIRQLLLQEYYRGQRLAPHPSDRAFAQAVAQARGMRHPHALLRTLLYDEAWRLGIEPQNA